MSGPLGPFAARGLAWPLVAALAGALSACAIDAPGSASAPATGTAQGENIGPEQCAHDLCEVGPPLDAACDPCVTQVCEMDPICCTDAWDIVCVAAAQDLCGLDCGVVVCEHDPCLAGTPLDPACDPCVASVCSADASCCSVAWTDACVAQLEQVCGIDCPGGACGDGVCDPAAGEDCTTCPDDCGPCGACGDGVCDPAAGEDCTTCPDDCGTCGTCAHDLCDVGVALDPTCDPCVASVCNVDPFCCDSEWDAVCVSEVEQICGIDCGGPPPAECGNGVCEAEEHCMSCPTDCGKCPACPHDVCVAGEPLPFGCDTCTPVVCKLDSFCCEVAWDALCVDMAAQHCARPCENVCAHDLCLPGAPLDPTCDPCATAVCDADPFCCTQLWDRACVDEAEQLCGLTCEPTP